MQTARTARSVSLGRAKPFDLVITDMIMPVRRLSLILNFPDYPPENPAISGGGAIKAERYRHWPVISRHRHLGNTLPLMCLLFGENRYRPNSAPLDTTPNQKACSNAGFFRLGGFAPTKVG